MTDHDHDRLVQHVRETAGGTLRAQSGAWMLAGLVLLVTTVVVAVAIGSWRSGLLPLGLAAAAFAMAGVLDRGAERIEQGRYRDA
ncbi:hypothetical protein [Nocardioides sp.]|uniref:hypothetical protein n=1 Tax=Nocardioides sp. TaxID=35761 RepID=UPI003518132C